MGIDYIATNGQPSLKYDYIYESVNHAPCAAHVHGVNFIFLMVGTYPYSLVMFPRLLCLVKVVSLHKDRELFFLKLANRYPG